MSYRIFVERFDSRQQPALARVQLPDLVKRQTQSITKLSEQVGLMFGNQRFDNFFQTAGHDIFKFV